LFRVEYEAYRNVLKSGKKSAVKVRSIWIEYLELHSCTICGKLGNSRKIQYRSLLHWYLRDNFKEQTNLGNYGLCMSCWNKHRVYEKREREIAEVQYLINKIKRRSYEHR